MNENKKFRIRKKNLQRMADYIKTIEPKDFSMNLYRDKSNFFNINCNGIGNVVGHCTILDEKNINKNYKDEFGIAFREWGRNFIGLKAHSDRWDWCFSHKWFTVDNTPIGASKRIEYLINHGLPHNWEEILNGYEPICY
jgi:hypothetical protein